MTFAQIIEYVKRGIFTLLGLFLALYLFVILLTYSANDPSWSHISSDMTSVNNMGGAMGAWLADLLYVFFGWGAWWLLAILVYESVLLWWESKPTFGLLRLIAYIFLLLAGSALCSQLIGLLPSAASLAADSAVVTGIGGGIVGAELASRLALLMTTAGSLVFLVIFVLITATFAFNIHWVALYQRIKERAWLGSGVKNDSADDIPAYHEAAPEHQVDDEDAYSEGVNESQEGQPLADEEHEYGQLPLRARAPIIDELSVDAEDIPQEHDTSADTQNNSHSLSNVLNEFLVKSGLGASLQQQLQAEQSLSHHSSQAQNDGLIQPSTSQANKTPNNDTSNAQLTISKTTKSVTSTPNGRDKVEPRFEWNDDEAVSSLLDAAAPVSAHQSEIQTADPSSPTAADSTEHQDNSRHVTEISPTRLEPIMEDSHHDNMANASDATDSGQVSDTSSGQQPTLTPANTKVSVDKLADSWLASTESEMLSANWEADKPKLNVIDSNQRIGSANKQTANKVEERQGRQSPVDSAQIQDNTNANPEPQPVESAAPPTKASGINLSSPKAEQSVGMGAATEPATKTGLDLTPTNTPPANPKEPPKVEETTAPVANTSESKPNIGFAVPDGGASNVIEDMMPDSEVVDEAPTLPAIEDDAAYAHSSRAMQTAKYREGLTPVPEISILDKPDPDRKPSYTLEELDQLSELLEIKLQDFNVKAEVKNAIPGPVVTRFEVELAAGVKASKVTGISRDLARSLSMASLRVVEVIPGKPYIGIEVPNKKREMVRLIELLTTEKYQDPKAQISMAMGKDIGGNPIITDLARAPHMLVAGTTGSGKSVLVNSMLLSMLLKYKPNELRLILIDPKQLELANYNDIPHLLTPVVTDMNEAASSLSWCVAEMERRYQLMSLLKVRKLGEFNKKVIAAEKAGKPIIDPLWRPNDSVSMDKAPKLKTLPMIVIVADEFADMIMQVGKQAEELITRLAQKSRAAGIHLMLATQRPSVDVITGLIKANIPVRAALRVNSKVDSRTILDAGGAEDMLGNGDMLFLGPGQIEPDRVHGAYVSDEEVNRVCDAWRERGAPDYIDNMATNFELTSPSGSSGNTSGEDDNLYDEAVAFVMETRKVSASSIQRKFSIGYNRAARIVDSMEEAGLVSAMGKSGKRELLM